MQNQLALTRYQFEKQLADLEEKVLRKKLKSKLEKKLRQLESDDYSEVNEVSSGYIHCLNIRKYIHSILPFRVGKALLRINQPKRTSSPVNKIFGTFSVGVIPLVSEG